MTRLRYSGWVRWLKFNFVGGIGIGVQLAALALLKSGLGVDYMLATALAVEAAVVHNFLWHERFTWADRRRRNPVVRLLKFNLTTGALSIVGNLGLMKLLAGTWRLQYLLANMLSIALCSLANFLVSDWFVFRERPGALHPIGEKVKGLPIAAGRNSDLEENPPAVERPHGQPADHNVTQGVNQRGVRRSAERQEESLINQLLPGD
jgi:putative flippase GtrA